LIDSRKRSFLPSFVRRNGRKLQGNRRNLVEELLPKLLIELPEQGDLLLEDLFAQPNLPLWFEIGFGGGEHLIEQARLNPGVNFIGCEPYINGVANLLAAIERDNLQNIRLFQDDARLVLEKLADDSLSRLFVLFPDPWRKNKHHKRRIISQDSLELFYRKIQAGGLLRIATDHVDYGVWILQNILAFKKFIWTAKTQTDWQNPPQDWVKTRYQEKAEQEGRSPMFIDLRK